MAELTPLPWSKYIFHTSAPKYFSALSKCEEILKTKSDSSVSGQDMDGGFVVGDIKGREIQEDVTRIDGAIYSNLAGILNIH